MLLTMVALVLWIYSVIQAKFEIGFYGLISSFPVTFFVALGILTIASAILWVSRENHGKLLFLQLCFLIVSIWLAPVMVGGAQPFLPGVYGDLGHIEYVARLNHFDQQAVWQHNWPIAWMFWASVIQVSGISMDDFGSFIPWIPFIWQFLLFLPVFMFFRNTIGKVQPNYCWAAMWLFYLGYWFGSQNTGAQAFGIFFVFSILALLTTIPSWEQKAGALWQRTSTIIVFAVLAMTHLLGSFVGLAIAAALYVARRMWSSNPVIIAAVFIAVWSIYGAIYYFEWGLPAFLEQGFRLDIATQVGIVNPLSGSESHAAVSAARIILSGLYAAVALLGAILAWKFRNNTYADITVLAIAVGCGIAAIVVGAGYGVELYQRFFIFLLPAMAYFGVKLLHFRAIAVILCIVLLIALPLSFVARYGNQTIDYLTPAYLSGADFFQDNTTHGYVTGENPIGRMKYREEYRLVPSFEELEWENDELVRVGRRIDPSPHYICISNHDRATYTFYYDEPQFIDGIESSLQDATNCNLVYANPDLRLYLHDAPE
ncbi:MAG: hypothetical protein WBC55_04090 [Dehalococcoidia bacterium]